MPSSARPATAVAPLTCPARRAGLAVHRCCVPQDSPRAQIVRPLARLECWTRVPAACGPGHGRSRPGQPPGLRTAATERPLPGSRGPRGSAACRRCLVLFRPDRRARSGRAAPAHATGPCQPAPPTAPPGVPGRHRARLAVLTARQHPRLTVDAATPQSPPSAAVAFYAPMVWSPAIASRQRRDHAGRSAPAPRCPPERPRPSRHRCCRC
jgi:hypothetical protein